MKIAHIGMGDIAQKAYLPFTTSQADVHPIFALAIQRLLMRWQANIVL
ncbi:hypothetical protein JCM19235_5269 [Vibrio maritimus]|uniref:Uncharacterized protein n=1 Tax=Vibrio maritimus TaxID=990268 RepID=A0A090RMP9_9VIBR|nr:hypothetical protein JCM19235_5269 [Vibrio maritimus]